MSCVINGAGLMAVWKRQLGSLLGNPLGYVFILAFVLISAGVLFLPNAFFTRNIADLGQLLTWEQVPVMPLLLTVLIPALAMGAWASERESGTEELLLTMPLTTLDAVLGKYLAVVTYVTIALFCSLTNVAILIWLGAPDKGLLLANYLGWWFASLAFAGWALFASVLVAMPAIAFVFGVLFCAGLMSLAWWLDWFDPFNRGVISLGGIAVVIAITTVAIGLSVMVIGSRRWRAGREEHILWQLLAAVFGLALAVNVARLADRHGIDIDVSSDGLSSLAKQSEDIVGQLKRPVTIYAFVSAKLPETLSLKRKELEDRLTALDRVGGDQVRVERRYPDNAFDDKAVFAAQNFNLKPRKEIVDSAGGREPEDVFLSAAVTCAGKTQIIDYFDPGLSVEFELVRAIRAVAGEKKRVLGVATTDLEMGSGFDFQSSQMRPAWQVYEEWKKQYEVRDVGLDNPVAEEIEALVVPQPSSLTEAQIRNLHDYIWAGRPCLILEDPLPVWSGPQLAASQPKKGGNNPYQQQEAGTPQKGDLKPLLASLGIEFKLDQVVWSDYSPSHQFRGVIPKNFLWVRREQGSIAENSPLTAGFEAMMLPYPGAIYEDKTKHPQLQVLSLIKPSRSASWGWHNYDEHIERGFMGTQIKREGPKRWIQSEADMAPAFAVEITGTMPSAYPKPDPSAAPAKPAEGDAKPDEPKAVPEKQGVPSAKAVHVIVIADSDFAHDFMYRFYRNEGNQFKGEEMRFLRDLRNIQFLGNAVDQLMGEKELLALRSAVPANRPLKKVEEVVNQTQRIKTAAEDDAQRTAGDEVAKAQAKLDEEIAKIEQQTDLDESAKMNQALAARNILGRKLELQKIEIDRLKDIDIQKAKSQQGQTIDGVRMRIRAMGILIPAFILSSLIAMLFLRRVIRERTYVPAARARSVQ
ncbi:MAG: Gldg family protein [Planctomycetes bacterium]|nr:Gldg family protein [Planctomycetota bacterium]